MPSVNAPADQYLINMLNGFNQRLAALERQQNWGITDSDGQLRHYAGAQWVDETTGQIVTPSAEGAVPSDTFGIAIFDENGTLVTLMGEQTDGTYGVGFFDAAGNPRTRQGQLPDGNYGTAIYSQADDGTYVEVNPPLASNLVVGPLTTTSTSYTTLSGSPSLTVPVGASGKVLVILSGVVAISGSTSSSLAAGYAKLFVDGSPPANPPILANSLSTSTGTLGSQIGGSAISMVTGLSQGNHALTVEYLSQNGQSVSFEDLQITAIPY